jgi:hypothetical protein
VLKKRKMMLKEESGRSPPSCQLRGIGHNRD